MDINRAIRAGAHRRELTPPVVPENEVEIAPAGEAPPPLADGAIDEVPPAPESSEALQPGPVPSSRPTIDEIMATNGQRVDEVASLLRRQLDACGIVLDGEQLRTLAAAIIRGGGSGLFAAAGFAQIIARTSVGLSMNPQASAGFSLTAEQAAELLGQIAAAPEQAEQIIRPLLTDPGFMPIAEDRLDVIRTLAEHTSPSPFGSLFGIKSPLVAESDRNLISQILRDAINTSARARFNEADRTIEETTALAMEQKELGNLDAFEELKASIAQVVDTARALEFVLGKYDSLLPQVFAAFGSALG